MQEKSLYTSIGSSYHGFVTNNVGILVPHGPLPSHITSVTISSGGEKLQRTGTGISPTRPGRPKFARGELVLVVFERHSKNRSVRCALSD